MNYKRNLEPSRNARFGLPGPPRPGRLSKDTFWSCSGPPEASSFLIITITITIAIAIAIAIIIIIII